MRSQLIPFHGPVYPSTVLRGIDDRTLVLDWDHVTCEFIGIQEFGESNVNL
jgi:hypothetical protein